MVKYGQLVDEFVTINDKVYEYFLDYFNDPVMTKLKNTDQGFSVYITKTYCLLSKECRYIVAITAQDTIPLGSQIQLRNIRWQSIQTRTLAEQYDIPSHSYIPKTTGPLMAKIHRTKITEKASIYACETIPLLVTLLHTSKKTSDSYQNTGTIVFALETWETIITFNE